MRQNSRILTASLFLTFVFTINLYPQFAGKINSEAGYYRLKNNSSGSEAGFTGKINGRLKYKYLSGNSVAEAGLNIRPELFGLFENYSKVKVKAECKYAIYNKRNDYNFKISFRHNKYNLSSVNINQNILLLRGEAVWKIVKDYPFSTSFGYVYQKINNPYNQTFDVIFADIKSYQIINEYFKIALGLYGENFSQKIISSFQKFAGLENHGFKFGPQFALTYVKSFIINVNYKFLIHDSDITKQPSNEHLIKVLAGGFILKRLSLFFIADYYARKITKDDEAFVEGYAPFELENNLYVKLGLGTSNKNEFYIKAGYENFTYYNSDNYSNVWNVTLGYEIKI